MKSNLIPACKNSDYNGAIRVYEHIHTMYKALLNRLDSDNEEYLEHISTTLYNIGILHILDDQFYKALDKFKEAEQVDAKSLDSYDIDYIVSVLGSNFLLS